ncbi:LysM peptidoglycan-binding domain-containing protein [Candidatus Woesearchaeota archaeon]|nr:LysM peptidoglycan-binding domain-containing protein [Candidatus Woesearchaeota archaeon]
MSRHYSPRAQSVAAVIPAGVSIDDYVSTAASAFGSGFKKHALSAAKSPVEMLGLDILAAKAYALAGGESKILNYISSSAEKIAQSYESGSISHDQLRSAVANASKGRAFIQREIGKELVKRGAIENVSDIYATNNSTNIGGVTIYGIKEGEGVIKNLGNIWEEKKNWNPRQEFWSAGLYSSAAFSGGAAGVGAYYARRVLAGGAIGGVAEAVKETTGSDMLANAAQKVGSLAAFSPTFGALSIAAEGLYKAGEKSGNKTVRTISNIAANTIEAYMAFAVSKPGLEAAGNIVADTFTPNSALAAEKPFVPNTPKEIADVVSHALNPKNNIIGDAGGRQIVQYTPTPEPTPTIVAQAPETTLQASPTPDSTPEPKSLPAPEAAAPQAEKSLELNLKDATKVSTFPPDAGKDSTPTTAPQAEKPAEPAPKTNWYDSKENLDKLSSLGVNHDNGSFTYTVQKGDTLSGILTRLDRSFNNPDNPDPVYKGHEAYREALELAKINNADANHLKIGQRIDLTSLIEMDGIYNEGKAEHVSPPPAPKETFSRPVTWEATTEPGIDKGLYQTGIAFYVSPKLHADALFLGWDKNNNHTISANEFTRYALDSKGHVEVPDNIGVFGQGKVAIMAADVENGKVNVAWYKSPSISHDKVELPKTLPVEHETGGVRSITIKEEVPQVSPHAHNKIEVIYTSNGAMVSTPSRADSLFAGYDGNTSSGAKNGIIDSYEFDRYMSDNGIITLDSNIAQLMKEGKVTLLAADVDDAGTGNIHRVDAKLAANVRTNYPTSANLYLPVSIHDTNDNSVINVPKTDIHFKKPLPETTTVYLDLNNNSKFDLNDIALNTSVHGNTLTIHKLDIKTDYSSISGEIDIPIRVHSPVWEKYMWNGDAIGVLSADIKPSLTSRILDFILPSKANAEENYRGALEKIFEKGSGAERTPRIDIGAERSHEVDTGSKESTFKPDTGANDKQAPQTPDTKPAEEPQTPDSQPPAPPAEPQKWLETEVGKAQLANAHTELKDGHLNYTVQKEDRLDNVLQRVDGALSNSDNPDDVLDKYEAHRLALELGKQHNFEAGKIKPGQVIDLTSIMDKLYSETGAEQPKPTGEPHKGLYVENANTIHLAASSALKAANPTHYVIGIDSDNNHKYDSSEVRRFDFNREFDTKILPAHLKGHDYFIGAAKVDGDKNIYLASVSAPHVEVVAPKAEVAPEATKAEATSPSSEHAVEIKAEESGERIFEWAADKMGIDSWNTPSMDELNNALLGNPQSWKQHGFSVLMSPLDMILTPFAGLGDVLKHSVNGKPLDALKDIPEIVIHEGQNVLYFGENLSHVVIPNSNDF